jgi:hypothetical protein
MHLQNRCGGSEPGGIIYLHSVKDLKVSDSIICDIKDLRRRRSTIPFVVATTMWDDVPKDTEIAREKELMEHESMLKVFKDSGVNFFRHTGELHSTHAIIRCLLERPRSMEPRSQLKPHLIA